MPIDLQATTEPGRRLVALAEELSADLAGRAAEHDRDGSYPHRSIRSLREAGYFTAPIPVEHGGLGVESMHDTIVASSRLARGDASVAIGVNMHLVALQNIVRRWQIATATGDDRRRDAFGRSMEQAVRDGVVMAAAVSELGQDLTRPSTTAVRTDDGWRIDGRKAFCTMSPAATLLYTSVTFTDDDGVERYGYAMIPADAPGVTVHDDWDAMGMRASGTNTVSLEGVTLPRAALRGGFPAGEAVPYMERNLAAGLFHASAALGVAEAADRTAIEGAARRNGSMTGRDGQLVAENAIDLTACRGTLSRAAALIDVHRAANPGTDGTDEQITALFAEGQAAKAFIGEAAARVVDRALALSGGAGYRSGHPIGRAYRDVRATAFMHPLGANRVFDFVAAVAVGRSPVLH